MGESLHYLLDGVLVAHSVQTSIFCDPLFLWYSAGRRNFGICSARRWCLFSDLQDTPKQNQFQVVRQDFSPFWSLPTPTVDLSPIQTGRNHAHPQYHLRPQPQYLLSATSYLILYCNCHTKLHTISMLPVVPGPPLPSSRPTAAHRRSHILQHPQPVDAETER